MDIIYHPGVNGSDPVVEFYPYTPSRSAGFAFLALFGLATIAHIILTIPFRAAYFIPLVLGGICEAAGYYGRAWSHHDRTDIGPWALQEMLILCAPPLISATVYMVLARIVRAFQAEELSSMRPKWMTFTFVMNDILCFCTQLGGAGLQVTGDPQVMDIGKKVVLGGLIFSLIVFLWFVYVAGVFHKRCAKREATFLAQKEVHGWQRYFYGLYVVCAAIMVRNLVRTIQFGAGGEADVNQKEAYIYVFDAFLMLLAMVVLLIYHPGKLIKAARRASTVEDSHGPLMENRDSGVRLNDYEQK